MAAARGLLRILAASRAPFEWVCPSAYLYHKSGFVAGGSDAERLKAKG
jgi:hypothetical protein